MISWVVRAAIACLMLAALLALVVQIVAGMVAMYRDIWSSGPSPRRVKYARRKAWRL